MLKPMDIHNKEFKKAVRGYDPEEVDEFLDEIIVDFEKMQRELDVLRNQINTYSDNMSTYRERESALNNALISAQQFADNIKKDAELMAEHLVTEAEEKAKAIVGDAEARLQAMQGNYDKLLAKYQETKENIKNYLQAQIALVEDSHVDDAPAETFIETPQVMTAMAEAAATETPGDMEETKLNEKLKEIMDSGIYGSKPAKGGDYRY